MPPITFKADVKYLAQPMIDLMLKDHPTLKKKLGENTTYDRWAAAVALRANALHNENYIRGINGLRHFIDTHAKRLCVRLINHCDPLDDSRNREIT